MFKKKYMCIISQRNGKEYIIKNSEDDYILLSLEEMQDIESFDCEIKLETNLKITYSNNKYIVINNTGDAIVLKEQEFKNIVKYIEENFKYQITEQGLQSLKNKGGF